MKSIRGDGSGARVPLFGEPQVDAVTDAVHVARGFDLGNVIKVATPEGAVVIDAASRMGAAAAARDALAEASPGGTRYLLYTHSHNDHTSGAEALVHDSTEAVVAHALVPELIERDHGCLGRWTARHRAHQRGRPHDDPFPDRGYVEPSLTFVERLDLEVGGVTLHLEHTEGETRDHLMVWAPELGLLCPGDLVYPAFPNLSTPAVGPRPIRGWIESLDRFLELGAEHLVPSHGPPLSGRAAVEEVLTTYKAAIEAVWDASLRAIDDGVEVDVAARTIELPEPLRGHPWLRPVYGTVNWGVRAVYDAVTGWYDLNPASLDPLPRGVVQAEVAALAGPDRLVARAREVLAAGDAQLALELADVVRAVDPGHRGANQVVLGACRHLRDTSTSANQVGFYHAAVLEAHEALGSARAEVAHASPTKDVSWSGVAEGAT